MTEANRSLQEFVAFLMSPDMYGSMSIAAQMLKWAVHAVTLILMLAAVIAVLFIVLKFACDVIYLTGVGSFFEGKSGRVGSAVDKVAKFASPHAVKGDIQGYIKSDLWKPIVTLAFIGLLASGMALPLAGQVAGIIGAGVDKIIGLDPATRLANFDYEKFKETITYTRPEDLKDQYDKAVAEMRTYRDRIYDLGIKGVGDDNVTLNQYKSLYTAAWYRAQMISNELNKHLGELKIPQSYIIQHKDPSICNTKFEDSNISNSIAKAYGQSVRMACN